MPRCSSSSTAGSMIGRSASAAMRMPTIGPSWARPANRRSTSVCRPAPLSGMLGLALGGTLGDVAPQLAPVEADQVGRGVRALARLGEGASDGGDVQHPAPGGDQLTVDAGGAGMEDLHALARGRGLDALD